MSTSTELKTREQSQPAEAVQPQERWLKPPCDVYENETEWLITADLPGVGRDALALHLDKDELVIEARRGEEGSAFAGYRRAFNLPVGVDHEKVAADLKHGVVAVHLPKSEALKPRRIAIRAG